MDARRIDKDYLAIVCGKPTPLRGTIDLALDRDPWDRRRVTVTDRGGQPSVTKYERLSTTGRLFAGAVPADHRPHASDPRAPGGEGLADRRRCDVRTEVGPDADADRSRSEVSATGAACVAPRISPAAHRARARRSKRRCPTDMKALAAAIGLPSVAWRRRIADMTSAAIARVRAALATQPRMPLATLPTPLTKPPACATRSAATAVPAHPDQARRSDLARPRRQQGAQARIPRRRCARARRDHPDHDRRGAIESRAHDGGGRVRGGHAVRAGADRDERRSGDRRQPAARQAVRRRRFGWCRRSIRCWPSARTKRWSRKSWPKNAPPGRVPYVIPVGGSSGVGVCGYVGGTRGARRATCAMRRSRRRGCITRAARAAPRRD